MRITDLECTLVKNIPPYMGGKVWLILQLETDEGIVGLGEWTAGAHIGREEAQIKLLKNLSKCFVIGADPFRIETLWHKIYAAHHDYRHPGLSLTSALSAIEIACWDIVGKTLNRPIYSLLGGLYNEKLRAYSYMPSLDAWQDPNKAAEVAQTMMKQGYTALKFDPFLPIFPGPRDVTLKEIRRVAKVFRSIREVIGDEVELCLGTHGQLTTSSAIRVAKALEPYDPLWFEEPVPPENVNEMARVAAHTSIPIATGERLVTKYEYVEVLSKQAAQIIQMDVGHCGGILEAKKIASMAEAHYASIAPHMYCGPVAAAAAIQLSSCSPNFFIQEFNTTDLHAKILHNPLSLKQGYLFPPKTSGLGITFNENVFEEYKVQLRDLEHLNEKMFW